MAQRLAPEVRRAQILTAAMEMIAEEGYRGLTLRALARRCDMSAPGVMHYFRDMPALLMAVLDYRDERYAEAILPPGTEAFEPVPFFAEVVEQMIANPGGAQLFATLQAESLDPAHPAHDYFTRRTETLSAWVAPNLAPYFDDPVAAAQQIMAILDGLQLHWLRDPERFDLRAHWAAVSQRLFRA